MLVKSSIEVQPENPKQKPKHIRLVQFSNVAEHTNLLEAKIAVFDEEQGDAGN